MRFVFLSVLFVVSLGCSSTRPSPTRTPLVQASCSHSFRNGDNARSLLVSDTPIQLPRIVASDDGWTLSWGDRVGAALLEVHLASLETDFTERWRMVASPRDGHTSSFTFSSPAGSSWGIVFDDDREGVTRRSAWFARVDTHRREVTTTWRAPVLRDESTHAAMPAIAWSPTQQRWGILTAENGRLTFHFVNSSGVIIASRELASGGTSVTGTSPLVWAGDRWAFVHVNGPAFTVETFRDIEDPLETTHIGEGHVDGVSLAFDGHTLGLAWTMAGVLWYARVVVAQPVHEVLRVAETRYVGAPVLVWNECDYVLAWTDFPESMHRLHVARIDLDGLLHDAHIVAEGTPEEPVFFASMGTRGREVALVWQVGQNRAMGLMLTP
jgi:hypothetical protein